MARRTGVPGSRYGISFNFGMSIDLIVLAPPPQLDSSVSFWPAHATPAPTAASSMSAAAAVAVQDERERSWGRTLRLGTVPLTHADRASVSGNRLNAGSRFRVWEVP